MNKTFTLALVSAVSALKINTIQPTTTVGDPMVASAQQYVDAKLCMYRYAINDAEALFAELKEITSDALFIENPRYEENIDGSYPWEDDCSVDISYAWE